MREINYGPVSNPDGSPSEITKDMLAGTGRDADEFAMLASLSPHTIDRKQAVNRMHTTNTIALIALARELLAIQDGSVEDALLLLDDGAGMSGAERDVVAYWIERSAIEPI